MVRLDLQRIRAAVGSIDPVFVDSPQYEAAPLSEALGCSMVLKVETLNPVRSFKGRVTETVMSSLARTNRHSSAVCASAGNLGQALAYSGARDTIADGVAGRFPIPEVLDDLLEVVDDVALVDDDSIKHGMRQLFEHAGLVVEPSAALGVAAVLEDPERFRGRNVATVICGSNITGGDFRRWTLDTDQQSTLNNTPHTR